MGEATDLGKRANTFVATAPPVFVFAERRRHSQEQPLFTHVLDLTHTVVEQAPVFTENERFAACTLATHSEEGYFAREISIAEHFGTHIDAPAHMADGGWTVDEIPPERLVRPMAVVDVSANASVNADYLVSVDDLAAWEKMHGQIPPGTLVLARTGWDLYWPSPAAYCNTDAGGAMHFPGYSLDAAKFLVEDRAAVGVGIDTLSVDAGTATGFPVHRYCAERSVYHVENVANLAAAPAWGALAIVAPPKFSGGSGAPVRILALVTQTAS